VRDKREKAELSLDDLQKGADFVEQAKEYSEDDKTREKGGKLGLLTREAMSARWGAPFAEAAFELGKDKISGLIKSEKGFHIIKCLNVVAAEDHPLEEVQEDIAKELLIAGLAKSKAEAEAGRFLAAAKEGKQLEDLVPQKPEDAPKVPFGKPEIQAGSTGMISRMGNYVPMLGVDEDLARTVFELSKEKPIPMRTFEIKSRFGQPEFVVVALKDRREPDLEKFSEDKVDLRTQSLSRRRHAQLAAWLQAKRDTAEIEVNQGFLVDVTPAALKRRQR
jgi:parvulin-like peptidyl-prolyl isomerase